VVRAALAALRFQKQAAGQSVGWRRAVPYLYLLPALLAYVLFAFVPIVQTGWISFHEWDGIGPLEWIGLENYRELIQDEQIRGTVLHVLVLIVFNSLLPVALGLLLAALLTRPRLHGVGAFRVVLFLPFTISWVVVAIAWRWIYAPEGIINEALGALGLGSLERAWLGDFTFALPALGLIATWVTFGFPMVLFLAGIAKIPASLYDAARIDGAGAVREFFAVTLPNLRNELAVAVGFTMILSMRAFALIFVGTGGGPGTSTKVPAMEIYERAFVYGKVGSAAAIGMILTVVTMIVAVVIIRFFERERK
jgi:raffinose/stachyose/melibiose transport system permease protein